MSRRGPLDIAIVGMACRFPGARNLFEFWENILAGVDATSDVPIDRRDPDSSANDRVGCRRGGYLTDPIEFDPASHGIKLNAFNGSDPEQFLVLDAARSALGDAGLGGGIPDGRRVDVIVGRRSHSNCGNRTRRQHERIVAQTFAILVSLHPEWTEADREAVRADLKGCLPPLGPDTVPGQHTNAMAGRVVHRFDLSGAAYVVDASSASSLVALDIGARSLIERRADIALVCSVYLEADVDFSFVFQPIGALSRSGRSKPFSADADGLVLGEGVGFVVLKRRADAERDGDRVYALLQGMGIASDGRGLGPASPSAKGHARAMRRAYQSSGIDPASVGLIEGQGLGVPAADLAELRAIGAIFPPIAGGRRVLGAVSSMIGHAMPTAGMAGLIKAVLSLHHRVLPPTLHAEKPHRLIGGDGSSVALNLKTRPWVHGDPATPRRSAVNAFGFAGINAHAILEEHTATADSAFASGALLSWESEAILLSATDRAGLVQRAQELLDWLRGKPDATLKDLAFTINTPAPAGPARIGLVAKSLDDMASRFQTALAKLADPVCRSIRDARGIYYWERSGQAPAKVAFLFPGEGSQYPGMLADLCPHFPEVRALFDTSDRIARESGAASWPSEHLFGPGTNHDPAIWSAEVGVNVVLSAQWAIYQLLTRIGLTPDAVVGHSSGELLALAASGVVEVDRTFEEKLGELGAIFSGLETSGLLPTARLVAVASSREKVEAIIAEAGGRVEVAMDNCPHQVVIAGEPVSVEVVVGKLREAGTMCEDLPFARAYHTPGFAQALGPIRGFFDSLNPHEPRIALYSCTSEARMPVNPEGIRQLAIDQWTKTVGFRRTIEAMHADGLNVFVDVGARGNLAGFVEDTLRGRSAFAVAANLPRRSGLTQINHLVASLFAQGVTLKSDHLYVRRRPIELDFETKPRRAKPSFSLKVGIPEMKLSQGLIERLRGKANPEQVSNERNGHQALNGHHGSNGSSPTVDLMERTVSALDADSTFLDFQETMADFLRTQQVVMDAFLSSTSRSESEFSLDHDLHHFSENESVEASPLTPSEAGPWAVELVSIVEGFEAVSMVSLEIEGDPVAENHTLGGRRISKLHPEWRGLPVLPFSVMAEMLAQAASRLMPGLPLIALRDVRAHKWIRYEDEAVGLEVRTIVDLDRPGSVRVSIFNRGLVRAMRPVDSPVFEGLVVFGPSRMGGPVAQEFSLENPAACRFTPESIYGEQWLFHGPALQAVVGIGPIAMGGVEGSIRVLPLAPLLRKGEDPSRFLTDPITLDNFTHLLGGWGLDRLADDGDVIFPLRMDELLIFGDRPPEGSDVSCRIAIREMERHRVRADADLVGPDGRIWMTIRGWEDWRFHWPGRYRDGFRHPDRSLLGEALPLPGREEIAKAVWLEPPADMGRAVWRDVLEHVQMGPDERAAYLAMPGPDARRTHRLWGRIAAKEAARRLWLDRGHSSVYPADLIIEVNDLGRPLLRSRIVPDRHDLPAISIAHVDGVAVAIACVDPHCLVGIDIEPVVERSPGFEATAFTLGERSLLGSRVDLDRAEWIARFWCAKEAATKATGLGFVEGPSGAEVISIDLDGMLAVKLRGRATETFPSLSRHALRVATERRGDFVWAWTLGEEWES